jgi:hypothetical protein
VQFQLWAKSLESNPLHSRREGERERETDGPFFCFCFL